MPAYVDQLVEIAATHRAEIEVDLLAARSTLERLRSEVRSAEVRVASLQVLLDLASLPGGHQSESKRMTLHDAMAQVLRDAPEQMMRAGDLASEIQRRHLYQMRDGRPVEPQQIHARVGHYSDLFEKVGTFIKLRS